VDSPPTTAGNDKSGTQPPTVKLHTELIPKDIQIVRCYYDREINPPGSTFGFDINGSGFTAEFEKMINVDTGNPQIKVKKLKLVTANQIHGDLEVGPQTKTGFVFPKVLIKNLPVFQAPEPFAVIRKGDVLNVMFTRMEEHGRAGQFRVFTHLDEPLAKQFHIEPSTPGITVSNINVQLPYIVEGTLHIGQGVPTGDYGLKILIAGKNVFERVGMIRIVRPNVGMSGFVQGLSIPELYRRPGDVIDFYVLGTGLLPPDVYDLTARVEGFDIGKGSFTYINPTQLRLSLQTPPTTPIGTYGVSILGKDGTVLHERKEALKLVPSNWVAGVRVDPPVQPGQTSTLRLLGRDFSDDFAGQITVELDEPKILLSGFKKQDAGTLSADITVDSTVRPGDYWLQLKHNGKKIDPPYGSIIKVQPPQP